MKTITLDSDWIYRTPQKTVTYPAGKHDVTNEIAAAAEAAGVWKEQADANPDKPAKAGKASATDIGEG